jgi:hypothetical protein
VSLPVSFLNMTFRLKDWAIFLGFEGLFLMGLSIGIWGSHRVQPDSTTALVFFCGSIISLIIGALVWWNSRLRSTADGREALSRPVSLDEAFRVFLRFKSQTPLLKNSQLETHLIVVQTHAQKIPCEAGVTCIVEHWSGPPLDVISPQGQQRLGARELLRYTSATRCELQLRSDPDFLSENERDSRLLVHFISPHRSVD